MKSIKVIIEHCESYLSKWLWLEYENTSKIIGRSNLIFTNIKSNSIYGKLKEIGNVKRESIIDLISSGRISSNKVIILDPNSNKQLSPNDFQNNTNFIVIGGILGDYPPKKRTTKLISSNLPQCRKRSLGPYQFSIDGAAYMALQVFNGKSLNEIPIQIGLKINVNIYHEIYLPYAYPIANEMPLISEKLVKYLKSNEIIHDWEEDIRRNYGDIKL